MFCIKCGAENSEEAVYCLKCGNRFASEEEVETIVAPRSDNGTVDVEGSIFSIRPTLLFVKVGYGLAIIGAFIMVALFSIASGISNFYIPAWISVVAGLSLLLIPAYFHIKQKMILYTLTDSKIEIDEGLISKTTRNVPLHIIQDVTVSANLTQRLLGFGNIEIENANENDAKIILKNINSPKEIAATLLDQMRLLTK